MARKKKTKVDNQAVSKDPVKVLDEKPAVLVEVPKVTGEALTEVPELITAAEVLTEVPPLKTTSEGAVKALEILLEIPDEPEGELLVEKVKTALKKPIKKDVVEPILVDTVSNSFSDEFAPLPQPRQPRGIPRQKSTDAPISLDSLSAKQRSALLGSFSKKSLAGRFGIKP